MITESLIAECQRLREERDEMKENYLRACQTVAAMHAAATGKPGDGPRRGVVEDIEDLRAERDALRGAVEKFEDHIEDIIAEFGDSPTECLAIISEHIQLARHFRAHPNAPREGL